MDFIEMLKAALIGLVEGITEWLPISSTGHMIIFDEFVKLDVSPEFLSVFLVVIQLGAILAVILLYFHRLNPFSPRKSGVEKRQTLNLWGKVIIGCIPAAVVGILLDDWMEEHVYNAITVAIALIVYGVAFIVIERAKGGDELPQVVGKHSASVVAGESFSNGRQNATSTDERKPFVGASIARPFENGALDTPERLSIPKALGIGLFQCLAIVPGTSRSGSTILGGRILGVSRTTAAEFSFFLAIPVMFGWSALKLVKGFVLDGLSLTTTEWGVFAVGLVVAFGVSVAAIRFLMSFIKDHSFAAFGVYRIILGIAVIAFFVLSGQL